MGDILYEAAQKYHQLRNVRYNVTLGYKCKIYTIQIAFPASSFSHLVGVQHLDDLNLTNKQKAMLHGSVLHRKITINDLRTSLFYNDEYIEERIKSIPFIEDILDENRVTYMIRDNKYMNYTKIKADFVLQYLNNQDVIYLFLIKSSKLNLTPTCNCCSIFQKHQTDYTRNTSPATVLSIEKIQNYNLPNQFNVWIYKR